MNLSKTFLCASILAATAATAGVIDDAKFRLDMRGGASTYTKPGDLGNAFDFSAASPLIGYMGDQRGPQTYNANFLTLPTQEVATVTNPYYPYTTNTQSVLHFYQDFKGSDKGSVNSGIVIPGAAPQTSTQTFYVRFRWDGVAPAKTGGSATGVYLLQSGNSDNGNSANGVSLYLDSQSVSGSTTNIYISCRVGANGGKHFNLIKTSANQIKAGEWNDVFLTIAQEADNATYTATLSVCKTPSAKDAGFNPPALNSISTNRTGVLTFDSTNLSLGLYHNSANVRDTTRCFRGLIADFMIWDRALTNNEKIEVMAGNDKGGEWQIGAVNNSADEFNDTTPAAVYDVQTMPWRQMQKTLDASHPTLSIATTMTLSERQMARALTFTPILSGASAPVEVALNGTIVGEIDLASTTTITLPKKLWLHDGAANTITVTRSASASGTIQFDAISLAPAPTASTVLEDATFKLDLRGGESTYAVPGDIGNAMDFSSASPIIGYMGDQRGPQTYTADYGNLPAQETADVTNPYYPATTNSQTVLHFYQENPNREYNGKGVRSSIVFPGAAPQGPVQTFYIRFRWDGVVPAEENTAPAYLLQSGNATNGNQNSGIAIQLESITVSEDLATTNALVGFRLGTTFTHGNNLQVKAGEWNDVFVTFDSSADPASCDVTASLCKTPDYSGSGFSKASLVSQSWTKSVTKFFDSTNLTFGGYHDSSSGAITTRSFRGLVADFMIWDRALTTAEKAEVMAGQHGAKWFVGVPNGCADEFGDIAPAAVFEPESMPWHRMRKTLDNSNRTLTLKSPVAAIDAGTRKLLSLVPILRDGAEASCPVAVSVNGKAIGTFDLADPGNRCILIESGDWVADASGNATVEITRNGDAAGTLRFDYIALSGTWKIGADDGSREKMRDQAKIDPYGFAGDQTEEHTCASVSVGANRRSVFFTVWVPEGSTEKYGWRFATKFSDNYKTADLGLELLANDSATGDAWQLPAGNHVGESHVFEIPAGTLHEGRNTLALKMTTPASGTGWATFDYYRLFLVPPANPFVIIMR